MLGGACAVGGLFVEVGDFGSASIVEAGATATATGGGEADVGGTDEVEVEVEVEAEADGDADADGEADADAGAGVVPVAVAGVFDVAVIALSATGFFTGLAPRPAITIRRTAMTVPAVASNAARRRFGVTIGGRDALASDSSSVVGDGHRGGGGALGASSLASSGKCDDAGGSDEVGPEF